MQALPEGDPAPPGASPGASTGGPGAGATPSAANGTAKAAAKEDFPVTAAEYRATAALLGFFVACMVLAVLFVKPLTEAHLQVFADPDEGMNILWYAVLIFAFTGIILAIAKWGPKWVIQAIILFAVGSTVAYVAFPLLALTFHVDEWVALGVAAVGALACVALLFWHPEWYVIDLVGLLVAASSAALFGISLTVRWVVALLVLLAVYDAIAVYRTKHMLSLADAVIELRLPVLLVIPKHAGYRFRAESTKVKDAKPETKGEREAMFMGLGDLVMPSILVVSALVFGPFQVAAYETQFGEFVPAWQERMEEFNAYSATYGAPAYTPPSAGADTRVAGPAYAEAVRDGLAHVERHPPPATAPAGADAATWASHASRYGGEVNATKALAHAYDSSLGEAPASWDWGWLPAIGAGIGTLVGYAVLMGYVLKGNPQAGLPLLNGGAITGFLVGLYWATKSIVFW